MSWAKPDLKTEHSFCYYSNSRQLIFSSFRETYSVLICKKLYFILVYVTFKSSTNLQKLYLSLCVVHMAKKGCQNARNKIFCDRKTLAAILFSLLVGYELISYQQRANQITEYLISEGSLYNKLLIFNDIMYPARLRSQQKSGKVNEFCW